MTIGEYIRASSDEELAALLVNWMITILLAMDLDYTQLNLSNEYHELLDYLNQPVTEEIKSSFQMFSHPSEFQS